MDRNEAAAALDAVNLSKNRLAETASWPLWRHAAYGGIQALIVAGLGLPNWAAIGCIALALILVAIVIRDDMSRHGMFVSGLRPGRSLLALACALGIFAAGTAAMYFYGFDNQISGVYFAIVIAVFLGSTAASLWWEKLYQAELRGDKA